MELKDVISHIENKTQLELVGIPEAIYGSYKTQYNHNENENELVLGFASKRQIFVGELDWRFKIRKGTHVDSVAPLFNGFVVYGGITTNSNFIFPTKKECNHHSSPDILIASGSTRSIMFCALKCRANVHDYVEVAHLNLSGFLLTFNGDVKVPQSLDTVNGVENLSENYPFSPYFFFDD